MRRDNNRRAKPVEPVEQVQQAQRHFGIDIAGRLVGDKHIGTGDHCTGYRHALLLTARQRCGSRRRAVGQAHPRQHFLDRCGNLALVGARQAQRKRDIVKGGEVRDQPEILKHHTDPSPQLGQAVTRHCHQILAEQADCATAGALGKVEQTQKRRLASARRAGQKIKTATRQRERHVRQRLRPCAVAQADIVELDDIGHARRVILLLVLVPIARRGRVRKAATTTTNVTRALPAWRQGCFTARHL